ncbi:hypothetical protein HYX06_00180 [Candidatus Woesearchaeota archaeon]|nr:hypothetical protein [Candidatus Woesearchaeota archaeon]
MIKKKIISVVYSPAVLDLFHYGHLQSLKFAKSQGDYYICGILTDKAAQYYKKKLVSNFKERKAIASSIKFIDEIMVQDDTDPTKNLKKIFQRFKDAKIILVHGNDWRKIPGEDFVKSINGKILTHPYYTGLSDFKIISKLLERYKDKFSTFEDFVGYFQLKDFTYFNPRTLKGTIFASKADTLRFLKPLLKKSNIEDMLVFTVLDWKEEKRELIKKINKTFKKSKIAVRSSALNEDSSEGSMAGYFHSELNVPADSFAKIEAAVQNVVNSYNEKKSDFMINQVLVQQFMENAALSGVAFTRTIENLPYYVINYDESGSTDSVTKGIENKSIKISRFCDPREYPRKFASLMESIKEIEAIIPNIALDIEFAVKKSGEVTIFQVRPLTVNLGVQIEDAKIRESIKELKARFINLSKRKAHLAGDSNIFGDMPDWNPAEIIGDSPNHLDYSLYDYVITGSVWHQARTSQGYADVSPAKLVVLFGNKPYVDVRNTFNSFIPAGISRPLMEKLMNFYFSKLKKNPELQDKVEFEIVYTCYDLSFDKRAKELEDFGFSKKETNEIRNNLISLTNNLIRSSKNSIWKDMNDVFQMENKRQEVRSRHKKEVKQLLKNAKELLDGCKINGTLQFSRLARLAFIGNILLKSMVAEHTITQDVYDSFLNSINTVAKKMNSEFNLFIRGKISLEEFLKHHGHLRPGTYDITSARYDRNPKIFKSLNAPNVQHDSRTNLLPDAAVMKKISKSLKNNGIDANAEDFLNFAKSAIEARELSKFEFTKSLSDAIELIAEAGELLGFSRAKLANLDTETLFGSINMKESKSTGLWADTIKNRMESRAINEFLALPPIIFSENDFDVVSYYSSRPNFITQKRVEADLANIDSHKYRDSDLKGKIIMLENGDPGYDWIFTKGPAGLITKYGGVASHMSIRSAEFGLPAAIGCGEIFDKIKSCKSLMLDCRQKKIMPLN